MEYSDQALQFLEKDYDLKVRYLSDQFSRMWTRFNFFLVLESGLSAALWVWFKDKAGSVDKVFVPDVGWNRFERLLVRFWCTRPSSCRGL